VEDIIHETARLHSTVVIAQGMSYAKDEADRPIHREHRGNVHIGPGAYVGPYTVIHRARIWGKSTIIDARAQIGSLNNIGHNAYIGRNTIITQGVMICGSCKIGSNCYIAPGVVVNQHITIIDGCFVGSGSVVTKDITKPGVYYGSPARWQREWDGKW